MSPDICPHCGADVPANAKACPGCGSDESTGWSEQGKTDGLNLPQDDFDYQDFIQQEFGQKRPVPRGVHWFWWLIAVIVLIILGTIWFR
jgi:uncharacterized membrane protein YvbJ